MADIIEFMNNREQWIAERYELARERMESVAAEDMTGLFREDYLNGMALFLHDALRVFDLKEAQILDALPLGKQKGIHGQLYGAKVWEMYGDLAKACETAGENWGPLLWAAGNEWRLAAGYALSGQRFLLTAAVELFLQIYQLFEMERSGEVVEEELKESVRQALYYHFSDYSDVTAAMSYHNLLIPGDFTAQLLEARAEEQYGLYRLGGAADEDALARSARWMALTEEKVAERVKQITEIVAQPEGARSNQSDGQSVGQPDTDEPRRVAVIVPAGSERLARALCNDLTEKGYEPVALRRQETFMSRMADGRPAPELSLFFDKALKERRLAEEKNALEAYKSERKHLAFVFDLMKEETDSSENQTSHDTLSERQRKLYCDFLTEMAELRKKF